MGPMIVTTPISCITQVLAVEEEMRELLKEMAAEKRNMEMKLSKNYHKHFKKYRHDNKFYNNYYYLLIIVINVMILLHSRLYVPIQRHH